MYSSHRKIHEVTRVPSFEMEEFEAKLGIKKPVSRRVQRHIDGADI